MQSERDKNTQEQEAESEIKRLRRDRKEKWRIADVTKERERRKGR